MAGLVLNGIEFRTEELPEEINFGGEQTVAVRKFPGGGLDLQVIGAFDDPIQWEGTFMFTDALAHCRKIDTLRIKGDPVVLEVSAISRKVIITKFTYKYMNDYFIKYQIEVQPVISYNQTSGPTVNGLGNNPPVKTTSDQTQPGATQSQLQPQLTYIVQSGDTLWKIANKCYKNTSKWTLIAQDNKLKNPNKIFPGMKLIINNPVMKVE